MLDWVKKFKDKVEELKDTLEQFPVEEVPNTQYTSKHTGTIVSLGDKARGTIVLRKQH